MTLSQIRQESKHLPPACLSRPVSLSYSWAGLCLRTPRLERSLSSIIILYISNSGIIVMIIIMSIITITFTIIVTSIIATSSRKAPEGWGVRWTELIFAAASEQLKKESSVLCFFVPEYAGTKSTVLLLSLAHHCRHKHRQTGAASISNSYQSPQYTLDRNDLTQGPVC